MIHRLLNLCDLTESVDREMQTLLNHVDDPSELQKLILLCRSQWIRFEERHDYSAQILLVPDIEHEEILTMVIVSAVAIDASASEEVLD